MTTAEVAEMTGIIAELEARLAAEKKKSKYWEDLAEMLRMRAQALSEEVELLK